MNRQHPSSITARTTAGVNETAGPRRRPGGRSARIQTAVFEALFQLLEEKGYETLSFATIAERAGVHETSLYRRWKTKEQLVVDAVTSQVAQAIPLPDTGALRSDLIAILQSLRTFLQSAVGRAIIQAGIATIHLPELGAFRKDYWQHRLARIQVLFDRAITRGELSPQTDFQLLLETLIGVLYVRIFVVNEPVDEMLPERIVNLVLSGVDLGLSTE
jgi:AcrR family transcriptional regulator